MRRRRQAQARADAQADAEAAQADEAAEKQWRPMKWCVVPPPLQLPFPDKTLAKFNLRPPPPLKRPLAKP